MPKINALYSLKHIIIYTLKNVKNPKNKKNQKSKSPKNRKKNLKSKNMLNFKDRDRCAAFNLKWKQVPEVRRAY